MLLGISSYSVGVIYHFIDSLWSPGPNAIRFLIAIDACQELYRQAAAQYQDK